MDVQPYPNKRKRDIVSEAMRRRLADNRNGQLANTQWLDLVTEPLVVLLLLVVPAIVILGPRFAWFVVSLPGWIVMILALVSIAAPLYARARRYARAPIHFEVLYSPRFPGPFWRPQVFETKDNRTLRFRRRLAPHLPLRPDHPYLVYYLRDNDTNVLLSLAPVDHPDADRWYPTKAFDLRFNRRTGAGE